MSAAGHEAVGDHRPSLDVMLIGPYPPPLGGISAHISRLAAILIARGLRVGVANHFGGRDGYPVIRALHRNPLLYALAVRSRVASLVHYHYSSIFGFLAVALTPRRPGSAYLATIHGHSLTPYLGSRIMPVARVTRWALRRFDHIVAVSPEVGETVARHLDAGRMTVVPAYLPVSEVTHDDVPAELERLLAGSSETLIVSAYRVALQEDHEDVYGLDIAVEAFARLAPRYPDLRLGIFLARPPQGRREKRFLGELLRHLEREGVRDRTALLVGERLEPAFAHDVIFLRPSRTDGDAVSIREALAAGIPVLASDAVVRPEGTHVLPTEDLDGWCRAIERQLELGRSENGRHARGLVAAEGGPPSPGEGIFDLYREYLPAAAASRLLEPPSGEESTLRA